MEVIFYTRKNGKSSVKEFIEKLQVKDRARILACFQNIQELDFDCPRVEFRQIQGVLGEIKIRSFGGCFRFFYIQINITTLVLVHAYKKQSQKTPKKEIKVAQERMVEVLNNEKDYT